MYGGFAKLSCVVSAFYDRLLESPEIEPYFAGVDMHRLIDHQTKFMVSLLGGPASFSNEQLQRAHQRLAIDNSAFEGMLTVLVETLQDGPRSE